MTASLPLLLAFGIALVSSQAKAQPPDICVRAVVAEKNVDLCASDPRNFQHVVQKKTEAVYCTRIVNAMFCDAAPLEFRLALAPSNRPQCVMDYAQEISNYCEEGLENYVYVTAHPLGSQE